MRSSTRMVFERTRLHFSFNVAALYMDKTNSTAVLKSGFGRTISIFRAKRTNPGGYRTTRNHKSTDLPPLERLVFSTNAELLAQHLPRHRAWTKEYVFTHLSFFLPMRVRRMSGKFRVTAGERLAVFVVVLQVCNRKLRWCSLSKRHKASTSLCEHRGLRTPCALSKSLSSSSCSVKHGVTRS